jgi:hypothetical protein
VNGPCAVEALSSSTAPMSLTSLPVELIDQIATYVSEDESNVQGRSVEALSCVNMWLWRICLPTLWRVSFCLRAPFR